MRMLALPCSPYGRTMADAAAVPALDLTQPGQLLFIGCGGTELPDDVASLISEGRVGGLILFARNVRDPVQVRALVDDAHSRAPAGTPLTVAIDQEGGRVQRLREPWTVWPPMGTVGARDDVALTRQVGFAMGRELADQRIDLDFAPSADVATNPTSSVIGDRSFAADPTSVSRHTCAFIEGMHEAGVATCAKHFPGHGDASVDSHFELPHLTCDWERLRKVELPPFRALIDAGVPSVMTAHVLLEQIDSERPATLSHDVISGLRGELGWDGLVFTDDLEMKAIADHFTPEQIARGALGAGVDALLVCSQTDLREALLAQLERLPDALLEPALRRMGAFKARHSGGRFASGATPPYAEHRALAASIEAAP